MPETIYLTSGVLSMFATQFAFTGLCSLTVVLSAVCMPVCIVPFLCIYMRLPLK